MSKPQVTITLGRSGQVVKRPAAIDGGLSDYAPSSGSKRSLRERLGSNAGNPYLYGSQSKNKRERRESVIWSPREDVDDARVDRDDLRYKLRHKNMSRQTQNDSEDLYNRDLRDKLTKTVRLPMSINTRQHMPEPQATVFLRCIPPTRNADDLLQMDSLRKSYTGWTLDGLRRRSPNRVIGTSRGLSPPRNMDELQQASSVRYFDAPRSTHFMSKDYPDAARPTGPTPFTMKATLPLETAKPVERLLPPSGIAPKSLYAGLEPPSVTSFLRSLGLEKYAIPFRAEEVDMTALKQMGDRDLKELGIPMGPRKKILLALSPRAKPQPR